MRMLVFWVMFLVVASLGFADSSGDKRILVTPSAGVVATTFSGGTLWDSAGPAGAIAVVYQISPEWAVGAKLGAYWLLRPSSNLFSPLYAGIVEYRFSERVALGVELPVLPGLTLTVDSHQIGLTVLPLYATSGGSTLVSLAYGYRWRL